MAEALTRFGGADPVEDAASRHLVHTFQRLQAWAKGDVRAVLDIFLMRWDLLAVKSLVRCRHHDINPPEAYASLVPGPSLTVALLHDLANRATMEALLTGISGWNADAAQALRDALPAYRESNDPATLEEALDRWYFVTNAQALATRQERTSQALAQYLQLEIDRINVRNVFDYLNAPRHSEAPHAHLLAGGSIPMKLLHKMLDAGSVEGAMEQLGNTRYRKLVDELFSLLQAQRVAPVIRYLERVLLDELHRSAVRDVLGLGVVMEFVWRKYNEVINLRLIARGLAGSLPKGRVREELAFV